MEDLPREPSAPNQKQTLSLKGCSHCSTLLNSSRIPSRQRTKVSGIQPFASAHILEATSAESTRFLFWALVSLPLLLRRSGLLHGCRQKFHPHLGQATQDRVFFLVLHKENGWNCVWQPRIVRPTPTLHQRFHWDLESQPHVLLLEVDWIQKL